MKNFSVFLPKTSFGMKGNLAQNEPSLLAWWESIDLYKLQRQSRKGAPLFILHDGPPYANGPIHLGHALNKALKDIVNRWQFMKGCDVAFIPGWDCHGLPIEAKIEEQYRARKDTTYRSPERAVEFRGACRDFAYHWVDVQKKGFQRLGVVADWEHPYLTMDFAFEAGILRSFFSMLNNGYIYRGLRPVWWSAAEGTALAEAEIEYHDVTSRAVYVRFPIKKTAIPELEGASVVIWTTTPWSLPGNRAIAYGTFLDYVVYEVQEVAPESLIKPGEKVMVAQSCLESFCHAVGITRGNLLLSVEGSALNGVIAAHPLVKEGYEFDVPLIPSEFTAQDTGTGFVHIAPAHGVEDFILGQRYQLDLHSPIGGDGCYLPDVPLVSGMEMYAACEPISQALDRYGALAGEHEHFHSYPHSWRSKKRLFCRTTYQWFISLDNENQLRQKALDAIEAVQWHPASAQNRIEAMVEGRPDWCISRQRIWGVPIAEFLNAYTDEPMKDPRVQQRIEERVAREGLDFWFTDDAWSVLDGLYDPKDWVKNQDIIDVWFESGVTHEVVLKDRIPAEALQPVHWPASLYLEGSDQHRGWFQSSLCTSVALQDGKPPFKSVLTHGFLLDDKGHKMSKSLGNVIDPQKLIEKEGADILRLWVAHEDYQKDLRAGPTIFERVKDLYRRFRNTLRYCLGSLEGFSESEGLWSYPSHPFQQWIYHRLHAMNGIIQEKMEQYDLCAVVQSLHLFCAQDLSAFYFDINKDCLYCDDPLSQRRREVRTALLHTFWILNHWLAPILCFTTEEAWSCLGRDILGLDTQGSLLSTDHALLNRLEKEGVWTPGTHWSIHLNSFPQIPDTWQNEERGKEMDLLKEVRSVVTSALEKARERKEIASSLQTAPVVYLTPRYQGIDVELLKEVLLTSDVTVQWCESLPEGCEISSSDIGVQVRLAAGEKCQRCWKVLPEVQNDLCGRCAQVERARCS